MGASLCFALLCLLHGDKGVALVLLGLQLADLPVDLIKDARMLRRLPTLFLKYLP